MLIYVCDKCKIATNNGRTRGGPSMSPPWGWVYFDRFYALLCPKCVEEVEKAVGI